MGGANSYAVRIVARSGQPAECPRADVRPADRARPRDHKIRGIRFWKQAVAMDVVSACRSRCSTGGQASAAGAGSEKFGWSNRNPAVGSMQRDGLTLGWGMAGCSWVAARFSAAANVQLRDDGTARVACATQDIGTGMYTILAQLASARTGVPLEKVEVELGDTSLPEG